jgi:hypothetical protein
MRTVYDLTGQQQTDTDSAQNAPLPSSTRPANIAFTPALLHGQHYGYQRKSTCTEQA